MKEIKKVDSTYLEEYDVTVKPYLTYPEIYAIGKAVSKFDSWAERETNIDILLLHFATDMNDEDIENIGHDALLECGLIDKVKENIVNFERVVECVEYHNSLKRTMLIVANYILEEINKKADEMNGGSEK